MTATQTAVNQVEEHKIYLFALDPVHVGAGGTQLGHVDNMIVRDPGDNLPKFPGTALSGMARGHAARVYRDLRADKENLCAGQGTKEKPHCGRCPVCRTFGTAMENLERQGAFAFQDALLLLFPVYSYTHGPVWVGSRERLEEEFGQGLVFNGATAARDGIFAAFPAPSGLALGRRLVTGVGRLTFRNNAAPSTGLKGLDAVLRAGKLVAVPEALFSRIVNENLEVRTSVSIDPLTGAAASGALFTYEALPRGSVLVSGATVDPSRWHLEPATERNPGQTPDQARGGSSPGADAAPALAGWTTPAEVVKKGLSMARLFGLGGMVTRGFGRVDAVMTRVQRPST